LANHDWAFLVNGLLDASNQFALWNLTNNAIPFTITGGAPSASIFVDVLGRVGLGTSTPARRLHIKNDQPIIRLEQIIQGSPVRAWDLRNYGQGFSIFDATAGSDSFLIKSGAPPGSIAIDGDGDVGLGTFFPESPLHLVGGLGEDAYIGIGPNPDGNPADQSALNVGYGGASFGRAAGFLNVRPDSGSTAPNPSLRFLVANTQRMILDNEGFIGLGVANPANPIEHSSGAVLTAGGAWQSVSSRAAKHDIRPLEPAAALAALHGLEPVRFYYQAEPSDEYVGFVAEDVPDLVATADRQRLGPLDIVAVLTKVVQQQQAAMNRQQTTIDALAERLGELEQRQTQQQR
jgi:hypothetical protein